MNHDVKSCLEEEILQYVRTIVPTSLDIVINEHVAIFPMEIDIYLPDLSIGIEVNGDYWHSDKVVKWNTGLTAEEYHRKKTYCCFDRGIQLLHIRESDWRNSRSDVEAVLHRVIGRALHECWLERDQKWAWEKRAA
jgi:hypothetical protein